MGKSFLGVFVIIAFLIPGPALAAGDVPDLKGTWVCKPIGGMKYGKGDPKVHMKDEDLGKPYLMKFTMTIDTQKGRLISGTRTSAANKEKVIGVISLDNKSVYMVDQDGYLVCKLIDPDKMEMIYMQATYPVQVVGQGVYTRKR